MRHLRAKLIVLLAAAAWPATAMPSENGADREAVILARVLSYDRNLKARAGSSVTIAVLSGTDDSERAEAQQRLRIFRELEKLHIAGLPIRVVLLEYRSVADLRSKVVEHGIDAIYLSPGLEPELEEIKNLSRSEQVLSLASHPRQIAGGLSVGAFAEGGGYKIHVNLAASRAEGIAFSSDLLALARVIR